MNNYFIKKHYETDICQRITRETGRKNREVFKPLPKPPEGFKKKYIRRNEKKPKIIVIPKTRWYYGPQD